MILVVDFAVQPLLPALDDGAGWSAYRGGDVLENGKDYAELKPQNVIA